MVDKTAEKLFLFLKGVDDTAHSIDLDNKYIIPTLLKLIIPVLTLIASILVEEHYNKGGK